MQDPCQHTVDLKSSMIAMQSHSCMRHKCMLLHRWGYQPTRLCKCVGDRVRLSHNHML